MFTLKFFATHYALTPYQTMTIPAASLHDARAVARRLAGKARCTFWQVF